MLTTEQVIESKDHFKNVIDSYLEKHPELGVENILNLDWLIYLNGPFEEICPKYFSDCNDLDSFNGKVVGFANKLICDGETCIPHVKIYIYSAWGKKIADDICKELSEFKIEYTFY